MIEVVLREETSNRLLLLGRDVGDDDVLVSGEAEGTLVNLSDLAHGSLERFSGLVLNTTILDESGEVTATIFSSLPSELIDVRGELERSSRLEFPSESLLNFSLEVVDTHSVDGVLDTCVLSAAENETSDRSAGLSSKNANRLRLTSFGYRCLVE